MNTKILSRKISEISIFEFLDLCIGQIQKFVVSSKMLEEDTLRFLDFYYQPSQTLSKQHDIGHEDVLVIGKRINSNRIMLHWSYLNANFANYQSAIMTPYNAQGPLSLTTESLYISGSNRITGVVTQVVFPMTSYDNNQLESVAETTQACVHKSS